MNVVWQWGGGRISPPLSFTGYDCGAALSLLPSSPATKRASRVWSTTTAADELQHRRHRPIEALGSAFAASLLVHLGLLGFLVLAGWAPGVGKALWSSISDGPLEVVLATTRPPAEKVNANSAIEITHSEKASLPLPREPALVPREQVATGRPGGGRAPRVSVDDRVPRARFDEAIEGPLAGFPTEVESPVRLPGKLAVPYPRTALEARREGTVLAWAIVDRQGIVEETNIVSGPADFNEAVRTTLAGTRLVPARDGGTTVRFYILLKFDFRLDDRSEATAKSLSAK